MSISQMSYVSCDGCGNPADFGDNAKEARRVARSEGYVYRDGRDLCRRCRSESEEGTG